MPVHYSVEKYDEYTRHSVDVHDDRTIRRLCHEYRVLRRSPCTLIDVGTGTAQLLVKLAAHTDMKWKKIIGTDVFEDMVAKARETISENKLENQVSIDLADVHQMPYPDASADFIISRSTIHHWADPVKAFQEIYRLLTPRGVAIIHEPRRDPHPEALAAFNAARAAVGVEPARMEEKFTPAEVKGFLRKAGLEKQSIVSAPWRGPGSMGFEVRIAKCSPFKVSCIRWIARAYVLVKSW
jgi:ubiquinone/menaquinone biosynthesis C-methylase UbiE